MSCLLIIDWVMNGQSVFDWEANIYWEYPIIKNITPMLTCHTPAVIVSSEAEWLWVLVVTTSASACVCDTVTVSILGFVTAEGSGKACWVGTSPTEHIRAVVGSIIPSFADSDNQNTCV